ncbi:MAG: YARHG domain-containing protein [Candidatus Treponema excrementipullorum]|uniref:YARHG domain-containing protein n=1 Tax=Candidatus Treponema excrementipullorum TaxID=2838768 RepID=A0A9E2NYD6_9SPIR|nr:YARHG domain-containing protein [Candidatus Treponema excrementipullorum]
MKKLLFILFILLTNNMFCLSENEVVKVLREDSLTNHFFNTKNYKYSIQDNKELNESEALIVLSVARNSLYEKYQNYAFLNNIYILNDNSIIFFNESFYINKSDISQTFYNQIKNIQLNNSTSIFADLNFDCKKDLFIFRGDSISFYSIIIDLSDLNNTTILFHSNEIDNHFFKSTEIGKLFGKNILFCIINNKRGFTIPYQIKNKEVITKFYYWSPSEQRYILDESVTQEQIKNAYCPEDFFAYNGLNFSKLDSKLKEGDLKDLDKSQLRVLRNAVYARHGRTFKSVDLQSLWECYTWYKKNPNYSDSLLTDIDKYNIELIQNYESK